MFRITIVVKIVKFAYVGRIKHGYDQYNGFFTSFYFFYDYFLSYLGCYSKFF
jgi:hypothetical protein